MNIVIVGSGIAGVTFAEKYRALSPNADIVLVTNEHDGYYSRPLLSRGFTKADIEQSIILKTFAKLRENGIDVIAGSVVAAIDRIAKTIAIDGPGQEKSLAYDKLILAQGSAAFIPPPFRPYEKLFYSLNSLIDLKAMRKFRQPFLNQNKHPHWAIVGGGLIGCEVASDLAVAGDKVTIYHAMDRLMERQLVAEDSTSLLKVLQTSGVEVLLNQSVQSFAEEGGKVCVLTDVTSEFDAVIVACGFLPRTELAQLADLNSGRGIKVNAYMQTNDEAIFALGDGAELPDGKLYAYILPIRSQALWLANYLAGQEQAAWSPAPFSTKAKVHGFEAGHAYNL
ncbi:FAD-dependent oxidoreductase [Methyloglobulus sp.]|uniref:NAD(P)/FAD-dependent oxidoreductase n=1 Tax=Methyloglobulus sp. TaxID=2518622 RepID=UPI0032B7A919